MTVDKIDQLDTLGILWYHPLLFGPIENCAYVESEIRSNVIFINIQISITRAITSANGCDIYVERLTTKKKKVRETGRTIRYGHYHFSVTLCQSSL